jgi:S-adenosylmethionine:tRNA ribosyltransferase-isomerase
MEARQLHQFYLPEALNATTPPERRGVRRDHVAMMVLDRATGATQHAKFYQLDQYLRAGDLLILNASRTVPAVLKAERSGEEVEVRLAHRLDDAVWQALVVAEGVAVGERLRFSPTLEAEVTAQQAGRPFVTLQFSRQGAALYDEIYQLGEPVRYEYIHDDWSLDYYQTVYASVPGSVEMPSAGRAFSWELLFKLQRKGVRIAYMQLHTGLSYLLDDRWHQDPRENSEQFMIPQETVEAVERCRAEGGRVIAVGTTVVRSLESALDSEGVLRAQSGWTNLYIHEKFPLRVIDGLITGFHEPEASHLDLLSAFVNPELLYAAYQEAIDRQYLWHEFGDMNLIIRS